MIERIKKSYIKELNDYSKYADAYKLSGLWTYATNVWDNLEQHLNNFASDQISNGISLINNDATDDDIKNYMDTIMDIYNIPISNLLYPNDFGFKGLELDDGIVIASSPRMENYANRLLELSSGNILEIGGGYGGVPYHLLKNGFNKTYLNFDIPNVSLVMKFFLLKMFSNKKILLYGEDSLSNYKKYDIVIMPHYMLPQLKKKSCDIIFNAHSLSEVGTYQISEYIKQIERIKPKYFLHFNHSTQSFYTKLDGRGIDKNKLFNLDEIKPNKYKRVGKWIEQLSESKDIIYYEYLYERNN